MAVAVLVLMAGIVACFAAMPAAAATCDGPRAEARIAAVLDDLDLALDDGRELRLAGVDPARATPAEASLGDDARRTIAAWLAGRAVTVLPLASPDRWDRTAALVWVTGDGSPAPAAAKVDAASAAEIVVAAGLGRVRPEPQLPPCFTALRADEDRARTDGLGLWADPYYAIIDADDRDGLAQRTGAMALVEGRVSRGIGRVRTFLRLGRGLGSFAATVSRRAAKGLAKAGLDPATLIGRRIRVRGFLDDRFGPQIDVTSVDQIEVLDEGRPAPAAKTSD